MSLDIRLKAMREIDVFACNVTHNLGAMAEEAGIYQAIWRPEELGITHANGLIDIIEPGLKLMKEDPERFKKLDPANGWGSYDRFVPWIEEYLQALKKNPDAKVDVWR